MFSAVPRLVLFSIFGVMSLAVIGCGGKVRTVNTPLTPVTVAQPTKRNVTEYLFFTGRVQAVESVDVRARVSGHLMKADFSEGSEVKAGQLLFQIDERPYVAVRDAAVAQKQIAVAQKTKAAADHARSEKLLPTEAVTKEDFDLSKARLEVAMASVLEVDEEIRSAQLNVNFTKISSPIAGRVSRKFMTKGNLISVAGGQSSTLTRIVSIDPIFVYFTLDENSLLSAQKISRKRGVKKPEKIKEANIRVEIALGSGDDFAHEGVIDFVDNQVDPETGTISVRAVFENKDRLLTPGLFARVKLAMSDPSPQLVIDELAIGIDQGQRFVYVVDKDNKVVYRRVELGSSQDGERIIKTSSKKGYGVSADEWVIVNGIQRVRPGDIVDPTKLGDETPPAKDGGGKPAAGDQPKTKAAENAKKVETKKSP